LRVPPYATAHNTRKVFGLPWGGSSRTAASPAATLPGRSIVRAQAAARALRVSPYATAHNTRKVFGLP